MLSIEADLVQRVEGAREPIIRLSGADLSDTPLEQADLRGADLREANLLNADLSYVEYFTHAFEPGYLIVNVGSETVVIDVAAPEAKFDEVLPKAQKVLNTVEWKGG